MNPKSIITRPSEPVLGNFEAEKDNSPSRSPLPFDAMILKKTLVRLAVFEFVEISRPAGPLLFDRKAMLTSAGVFFHGRAPAQTAPSAPRIRRGKTPV